LLLLPVGAVYFAVYYALFRVGIEKFNLPTPGREQLAPAAPPRQGGLVVRAEGLNRAARLVAALGGAANLRNVDACTTRLRLTVLDAQRVDLAALKLAGALGVVRPSATAVQVVLGPIADQVAGEIRSELRGAESGGGVAPGAYGSAASVDKLLQALGGADNLLGAEHSAGRVLLRVVAVGRIDRAGLDALLARGHGISGNGLVHLLCGPESAAVAAELATHATATAPSKH
jgi:PTS system N-acetylglucosamine-specific IIC component